MKKYPPKHIVVADFEARNTQFIVDPFKMECMGDCKCLTCFHQALDRLVKVTEEYITEDQNAHDAAC